YTTRFRSLPRNGERVGQRQAGLTPPGLELQQRVPERRRQRLHHRTEPFLQAVHVEGTAPAELLTCRGQLVVPCGDLRVAGARLEQRVALAERTRIPSPDREKALFHVEQTPVDEAPARLATARHQRVAPGLEGHHHECRAQLPQMVDGSSIHACFPAPTAVPQARAVRTAPRVPLPLREHLDRPAPRPHQAIADAPPEAAAIRQQVDALEDAGLPRAIGTDEEIEPAARAQLDVDEVAQVAQLQPDQAHRTPSGKAERPDEAGRSCSTWNRGWITASTASRRGASARWRPRAPAPRSWRPAGPG